MLTEVRCGMGLCMPQSSRTWVPIQEAMLALQASLDRAAIKLGRLHSSYASGVCRSNETDEGMLTCWPQPDGRKMAVQLEQEPAALT